MKDLLFRETPLSGTGVFLFACKLAGSGLCGKGPALTFPTGIPEGLAVSVTSQGICRGHVLLVGLGVLSSHTVMGCFCREVLHAAESGVPPLGLHPGSRLQGPTAWASSGMSPPRHFAMLLSLSRCQGVNLFGTERG